MDGGLNTSQGMVGIYPGFAQYRGAEAKSLEIKVDLVNLSMAGDFIKLEVRNIPRDWVEVLPSRYVFLDASKGEQVTLRLSLPDGSAGDYSLTLSATRRDGQEVVGEATILLQVTKPQAEQGEKPQPAAPGRVEEHGAALPGDPASLQATRKNDVQPVESPVSSIGVNLASTSFIVRPGEECVIPVRVAHYGLERDRFTLSLESKEIPLSWMRVSGLSIDLERGEHQELSLKIAPPEKITSRARQFTFSVKVQSAHYPEQVARVECRLTLAAVHKFTAQVAPQQVFTDQAIQVTIHNEGNAPDTFEVSWLVKDQAGLAFEVLPPPPTLDASGASQPGAGATQVHAAPGSQGPVLRIDPGKTAYLRFKVAPKSLPILGKPRHIPFDTRVTGADGQLQSFACEVTARPIIPTWAVMAFLALCLVSIIAILWMVIGAGSADKRQAEAVATQVAYSLTQTVSAEQTAAAFPIDSDGDGLLDKLEESLGTNPYVGDTDIDGLSDGDEVNNHKTDPKVADFDQDGLIDGDEVNRGTNPTAADTDSDRLKDGEEVRIGSDPKAVDTDLDGLIDGDEAVTCTSPIDADSDDDKIPDDEDLEPCDKLNPMLTQTALALTPTLTPTFTPTVTLTPAPPTATPTATNTPVMPGLPGSLLFSSSREGRPQIYLRDMNTGAITRLTVSNGEDSLPAWSPDGSQVAFTSNRDGNLEIYVMDANGTNQVNLTNDPHSDSYPAWSPDGEWLAFSSNRDGNDEIYVMRVDGSQLHNISNHPASDTQPNWEATAGINSLGGTILFVSDRDGNLEIYKMGPDGEDPTNLTNNGAKDYQPEFSPSGGQIAFVSERSGNPDIFVMDIDGDDPINLTPASPGVDQSPGWSGDSQWIAFSADEPGNYEIYIVKVDGSLRYNITVIQGDDRDPAWR